VSSDIETFLDVAKESTAKTISIKLGLPQDEVAKELHRMHAGGVVEREKRKGGGNEYTYWLSRAAVPASMPIDQPFVGGGTESPTAVPAPVPNRDELDSDLDRLDAAIARASEKIQNPEVAETEETVNVAFERLCGQVRELLDVLGLPPTMKDAIAAAKTMIDIAKATATERDELKADNESNKLSAARWKLNCAELEQRLDELTIGPIGAKSPLFVTVGRYSKPMRHDSLEKAQKRGKALVRGEKESEVLVLEPVGKIVRGTEWVTR
jgi:hypothetical protein